MFFFIPHIPVLTCFYVINSAENEKQYMANEWNVALLAILLCIYHKHWHKDEECTAKIMRYKAHTLHILHTLFLEIMFYMPHIWTY